MQSTEFPTPMSATSTECFDLSDYCRLCLQLPDECDLLDLQLIYDEDEHLNYYDCFTICTQIDLRAGGVNAPHQLCKSCGLELQVAYDFYKKVEESKKFLMQLEKPASVSVVEASETPSAEESPQHKSAGEVADVVEDDIEIETKLLIPVHLESELIENGMTRDEVEVDTSMEYEELEEQVDILEEYQSVDELVDEDAETVQIVIDDGECEGLKVNLSADGRNEVAPVCESQNYSRTSISESNTKANSPSNDNKGNSDFFEYESNESDSESTNNTQKSLHGQKETDALIPVDGTNLNSIVITKKGDVRPRRRFSGEHSCDYCQKVFKNRSRMLSHRRSHEPNRPKFECEECGRLYATKQAKGVHVNTVHNRNGLKCPICDKVFVGKKLLEVHMRYHTGDFPYACDLCDRKFAQMSHLNTHKNVKHNSERYTCEHPGCGKFFTSSASLRNHEFSHSEMPFECTYCKRGYPAKSKIKVHIRQKHGIEVSLEQIEDMRKFHVMRSKLNLVKIADND